MRRPSRDIDIASEHDAGIAQVLVAVDQVDLPDADFPTVCRAHQAMPAPARQKSRSVHAKLADQEIRADHADRTLIGGERLDIRDHADSAGFWRLRPGVAGAQAVDPVLHAPTVIERNGDFAPRVSCGRRSRHPVDAFGCVHRQPFVEGQLVEQTRFLFYQHPELIALGQIVYCQLVPLPVGEARHQLLVELLIDVIGAGRGVVDGLHYRAHGSRWTARWGVAFISRFHSLMYSRMNASSVAGAVMMPFASVFTRPGMSSPRCM